MSTCSTSFWKRLWRRTNRKTLKESHVKDIVGSKEVIEQLISGLNSYKPLKKDQFAQLQTKNNDQTKLLNIVQTLLNYIDIDAFQLWDIINHYLCDISYGTPVNAFKNVNYVDTRPSYLLPNIWRFYQTERLYLLKLLHYIIEYKDDAQHIYCNQFREIFSKFDVDELKNSLLDQLSKVINATPPSKKINSELCNENLRQEWIGHNLREQFSILQTLLLIANDITFTDAEFKKMFELFRKHSFGKNQNFMDLLEERHREYCTRIMYSEISLFMVVVDAAKIKNISSWIESSKHTVESELIKIQLKQEYSGMLMSWMLLTLHSQQHAKQFEGQYQQLGATALKLHVFEFLQNLVTHSIYLNDSKVSVIIKQRVFHLLNELCNKFDSDGLLGHQPGAMQLCSELLKIPGIADEFWELYKKEEDIGIVSFWNTALEYFPFHFRPLSILSTGLAQANVRSANILVTELQNLPVFTEIYKPRSVPITKISSGDDVIVGSDYYPLSNPTYRVDAGSKAAVMERKDVTMIHFRTPYSYWTVFNSEIERSLDRKVLHYQDINATLEKVWDGTKLLKELLTTLSTEGQIPKFLVAPSEGVFDVLVRFMRAETPPLPLLVSCLEICNTLIPRFPKEIYLRLINTGLLPRILNHQLSYKEYAEGASFDSAIVGSYLVTMEQPNGKYDFLVAYIDMLYAFLLATQEDRVVSDILLPGLVLTLRELFANICSWRYNSTLERRRLIDKCVHFLSSVLQRYAVKTLTDKSEPKKTLYYTCIYSFLNMENAVELLKIVATGNEQLERMMYDEPCWVSGSGVNYLSMVQRAIAILMLVLRQKSDIIKTDELTPLEQLIFAQNKQNDNLKVVPKVTSYLNHCFNEHLPRLGCQLLTIFAADFQMSLFTLLDMTSYQVRIMFLERLWDHHESLELKVMILEFVATCIGKQPGLTEAFFKLRHLKQKSTDVEDSKEDKKIKDHESADEGNGILVYMAQYLCLIKRDASSLSSPLLASVMTLFHELWKNNMQILIKELSENSTFWSHLTSPLFSEIEPGVKAYGQIFNVLGMELFTVRDKVEPTLKQTLEIFFDTNEQYLDTWINFIFSFEGRDIEDEMVDRVPTWLALLTSWKDFTMIFCKYLPFSLNIAHKSKMVAPCMNALLKEFDDLKDGRLVVILAELYVIMLANWKDDCFDNRKANARQIDQLLTNAAFVYDSLHLRAKRAILSIGTVAISTLDYEIKANNTLAQNVIRAVTNINTSELGKLFDDIKDKDNNKDHEEIPPIVLSLAMLEQCLDLYDDMFSGLGLWFQSSRFINKLLSCLQTCIHDRKHYHTSLAALRCLTAYSRGPFSRDLLLSDVDQFLWLQLLPPKLDSNGSQCSWKPTEWWRVYAYSLDFISMMVMKHGQFFASDAITFVGVHLEYLIESVLLPRQVVSLDSMNLCASTLNLIVQLVKFEARWRIENITSLVEIMRSISACLYQCVTLCLRTRWSSEMATGGAPATPATPGTLDDSMSAPTQPQHSPSVLNRILEILHMATLCLLSFSPDLLSLLADPGLDLERWQPLVELHFGAPKISYEPFPQLTFGTLLSAICMLTKSLNHAYQVEEGSGSRSPRGRRRGSYGSPSEARRVARSESLTSLSSGTSGALWTHAFNQRLVAAALEASLTLLASQALLAVRDPNIPARHKQLVRRELSSELTLFHDFVRKRILCAAHARPHLIRNKLGAWPLATNEEEMKRIDDSRKEENPNYDVDSTALPPPPPPKRSSNDSMRQYILRKHYLDKCAQTPTKDPPSPISHSTPTVEKKKRTSRSSKRVSWAETTTDSDETDDSSLQEIEPVYSNLTDVQINNDEDYFHFMSVVFLYVCQTEL